MIRVQNHRHAILLRHRTYVVGAAHGAGDGGVELGVVQALPAPKKTVRFAAKKQAFTGTFFRFYHLVMTNIAMENHQAINR